MQFSRAVLTVTAAATAAVLAAGTTATAHPRPAPVVSDPLASGLAGPLQLEVAHGNVFVGQAFAGLLTRIAPDGTTTDLVQDAVNGLAVSRKGIAFTTDIDDPTPSSLLKLRAWDGTVTEIADLYQYESDKNPDAGNTYGFLDLDPYCAQQVPAEVGGGDPYTGQVDAHPYALANGPRGGWYVAEAGGNAVLYVSARGDIRTVAVLPPQVTTVTADAAAAVGLPDCTVGHPYAFEPVPTDVEVSRSGQVFVTLLPGGPEDASLGARGSVVRLSLSQRHGGWARGHEHGLRVHQKVIASGFLGATNLALGPRGSIYVTELFANRLSQVRHGQVSPVVDLTEPAAVEYSDGKLYVGIGAFSNGQVVTVTP